MMMNALPSNAYCSRMLRMTVERLKSVLVMPTGILFNLQSSPLHITVTRYYPPSLEKERGETTFWIQCPHSGEHTIQIIVMSSHSCLLCFCPAYPVISDRGIDEYVCLTELCHKFKISVHESETIVNSWPQVKGESDYPVWPLLDEQPSSAADQLYVAQPWPLDFTPPVPVAKSAVVFPQSAIAVPQSAPSPGATRAEPRKARHRGRKTIRKIENLPGLEKPFSEMTPKEGSDPMTEITTHVYRSIEERQREAEIAGKVKRPVNAFMLYRTAYSATFKHAGEKTVSRMAGKSWGMESNQVRDEFIALAKDDKILHEIAFPNYRFAPRAP